MAHPETSSLKRLQIWHEVTEEVREGLSYARPIKAEIDDAARRASGDDTIIMQLTHLLEHVSTAEELTLSLNQWPLREREINALSDYFSNLTAYFLLTILRREGGDHIVHDFGSERHAIFGTGPEYTHRIEHNVDGVWVLSKERRVQI